MSGKDYQNGANQSNQNRQADIQHVTLPYDFIPFPEKWHFYQGEGKLEYGLHAHNNAGEYDSNRPELYSGSISYQLIPQSDLAIELKEGRKDHFFVSGSSIRGCVRRNLEILSYSYPEFVDTTPMLYRDFTRESYKERMGLVEGIEKSVRVGFLKKVGNEYYIVPAQPFPNDKNFVSIKEHQLKRMGFNGGNKFNWLYSKKDSESAFKRLENLQNEINKKNKEIMELKEKLQNFLQEELEEGLKKLLEFEDNEKPKILDAISKIFQGYSFVDNEKYIQLSKKCKDNSDGFENNPELIDLTKDLKNKLDELMIGEGKKLEAYFKQLVDRWKLKACIDLEYNWLDKNAKNLDFEPYQIQVQYRVNENKGISEITMPASQTENQYEIGYLFNSTRVGSKRSHYFVQPQMGEETRYLVPSSVVQGYNSNFKRMRFPSDKRKKEVIKAHYKIFDDPDNDKNGSTSKDGSIIFFKLGEDGEIVNIGRTPYFKIPYRNSLEQILKGANFEEGTISYADAIFGFTTDKFAYKSRVRFSSLEIKGNFHRGHYTGRTFLLASPSATANAMYIKQNKKMDLKTYEDELRSFKLNGYKYYHIKNSTQKTKENPKSMISGKGIISISSEIVLEGKIRFNSLTQAELGLLLISLDITEAKKSKIFSTKISDSSQNKQIYEQIGGAKPYGYGKVKVKIASFQLEKKDCSFESLIYAPFENELNSGKFIDAFFSEFNEKYGGDFFRHFKNYFESKIEGTLKKFSEQSYGKNKLIQIDWFNVGKEIGGKGGGYPKKWRLFSGK